MLLLTGALTGQTVGDDLSMPVSMDELRDLYEAEKPRDISYINGVEYNDIYPRTAGHPFFQTSGWVTGTLSMNGKSYKDLLLRYDLYKDQLLYNHFHPSGSYAVVLNTRRVEAFEMEGKQFMNTPDWGYLEVIIEGKASFYRKWTKSYNETGSGGRGEFRVNSSWLIRSGDQYDPFSRRSGLIRILEDHKAEVKDFIRKNRITISPGREEEVANVIRYYNTLLPLGG